MAGRNPSRQPFHVTKVDLRSAAESPVAGTAYDLGGGNRWPPFSLTNAGGDHPIGHGRSGDAACRQPTRCFAVGYTGLETVRAKPCWSRFGLRTISNGEPSAIVRTPGGNRDVSSSRSPALFLGAASRPRTGHL